MVAPTSFFNDYGGHIRILEETLALQFHGHQVTIVTYYKGNDVPGLDIRRSRALPWHAEYVVGSSRHKVAFDLYLAAKALRVGWQMRPDIVHGHMHEGALIGSLVARMFRVPLVFDFQGSLSGEMVDHNFLNPDGWVYPWVRRMEKAIDHLPNAILTSSHRAQGLLRNHFGVKAERIFALPDCVDTDRFDPAQFSMEKRSELRRRLGIPEGRPIVVYLGLLADYQGTPNLVEAAANIKANGHKIHFLVMGFPNEDRFQNMAEKLDVADQITFTGRVQYEDAPGYLALGDLAVAPKMSTTEGSGKVLNYMAMGLPTVAYDTPVHREYLANLGSYATLGDVKALAQAIVSQVENLEEGLCNGRKLRQRAIEKYSWRRAGEEIVGIYGGLINL